MFPGLFSYQKSIALRPNRLVFPTICLSTSLLAPINHPALLSRSKRSKPVKEHFNSHVKTTRAKEIVKESTTSDLCNRTAQNY